MGFEVSHSIKERLEQCKHCEEHTLRIIPSIPTYITKTKKKTAKKAGSLVEEYIEKNREQLKDEKKKLKEVEYK